jgi:uncharacterized protein YceK
MKKLIITAILTILLSGCASFTQWSNEFVAKDKEWRAKYHYVPPTQTRYYDKDGHYIGSSWTRNK